MLVLGGKSEPTAADVEKVVKEAGAEADKEKCAALCEALKGKEFHEFVEAGLKTLSSMGGGSAAAAPAGGATAAAEAPKEKEAEPEEEVDIGGMFGDEDDY